MDKLKSRKLWVTIVSAVVMVANQGLGFKLPEDTILSFAGVVMSYIFGQSIVDAKQQTALPIYNHAESLKVMNDQADASVSSVVKDYKNESAVAPTQEQEPQTAAPVQPVVPVVDPNQEKINKISELQQQINQLQAEISQPVVNSNPSVVITQ